MSDVSYREMGDEDLVHLVLNSERTLVRSRFKHSQGQLENTASLGDLRKNIARANTELRARELANGLAKGALVAKHRGSFVPAAVEAPAASGDFLSDVIDTEGQND